MHKIIILSLLILMSEGLLAQPDRMISTQNGQFPIVDQGEGIPVLFLHGFPDSKELWVDQIEAVVSAGYRALAPDLRGYGKAPSPLDKDQYSMPVLISDVIGLLDALRIDQVHLVGHDWGAVLSWYIAQYYPDRVLSLTALSVGCPGNSGWNTMEQNQKSWYFYLFLQEGLAEKTWADQNWKFGKEFLARHKHAEQILEQFADSNSLTTALNWYRGNLQGLLANPNVDYIPSNEPAPPRTKIYKMPVLGVWSDMDFALTEAQMKKSEELIHDFTYRRLHDAGHWMMLEKPEEVNEMLLTFLQRFK